MRAPTLRTMLRSATGGRPPTQYTPSVIDLGQNPPRVADISSSRARRRASVLQKTGPQFAGQVLQHLSCRPYFIKLNGASWMAKPQGSDNHARITTGGGLSSELWLFHLLDWADDRRGRIRSNRQGAGDRIFIRC